MDTLIFTLRGWDKTLDEFSSMIVDGVRSRENNDLNVDNIIIKTDGRNETNYKVLDYLKKNINTSHMVIEFTVY